MTEMINDDGASNSSARIMTRCSRGRSARRAGVLAVALLLALASFGFATAAQAQAKLHEVVWAHGTPENVARFVVFVASSEGDQAGARQVNVGKPANPTPTPNGYLYSAVVSAELNEYIAVAAVAYDGSLSELSDWSGLPPTKPGQPFYIP
jgi:hypothetical protein